MISLVLFGAACGDDGGSATPDGPQSDAATDGPAALSCASYCTTLMTNCTAGNQQFGTMGECMSSCMHYPLGTAADTTGNTLGCRTYHAGTPAAGAPATHCRHAGPGGGGDGACGADCLGFCTLVLGSCTGANAQYGGDMSTCMTTCNGYIKTPEYNSMQTSGDTFSCRLYHATAASANPAVHCAHTGANSGPC